ncbi:MAG: diguanylate cyclase [bacterium]
MNRRKMGFADLILIYARALVYLLVVSVLLLSPRTAPNLFELSQLSIAILVSTFYVPLTVFLKRRGITKENPKVDKILYFVDMALLSWVVGVTGGINSPIYPFLFLPVIFISFDHGTKDGLIFSLYASIVGSLSLSIPPPPKIYYFIGYIATLFTIALTMGSLADIDKSAQEKEKNLSALRSLIFQNLPYEEVLPKMLEILARASEADAVAYLLYDEESGKLRFQSIVYGLRGEEEKRMLLEREISLEEGGISVEVFKKGESLLVKDAKSHPTCLKDIVEEFLVGSVMSFPIKIMGVNRGVFHIIRREGRKPFGERDFQKIRELAGEAMIVFEVMETGRALEKRKGYLEILLKLISNLSRAINIEEVGRELTNALREIVHTLNDVVLAKCTREQCAPVFHFSEEEVNLSLLERVFMEVKKSGRIAFLEIDDEEAPGGAIGIPVLEGGHLTHILVLFTLAPYPPNEDTRNILTAAGLEIGNILSRVYSIAELERYAFHDHLTRLLNRRMFYQRMGREIKGARRYGYPISLVLIDIDNFKEFNDTYGHLEGDRILAEFGRLLKQEIRASDYAARLGGEEFAVVLPHTPKDAAAVMAERLRKKIKEELGISVSMGIGEFPTDANTLRALLRKADEALYEAKRRGKGRIILVPSQEKS